MAENNLPVEVVHWGRPKSVWAWLRYLQADGSWPFRVPDWHDWMDDHGFTLSLVGPGDLGEVNVRRNGPLCVIRLDAADTDRAAPAWLKALRALHAMGKLKGWKPPEIEPGETKGKGGRPHEYSLPDHRYRIAWGWENDRRGQPSKIAYANMWGISPKTLNNYYSEWVDAGRPAMGQFSFLDVYDENMSIKG